jgi:hypothetical protein
MRPSFAKRSYARTKLQSSFTMNSPLTPTNAMVNTHANASMESAALTVKKEWNAECDVD